MNRRLWTAVGVTILTLAGGSFVAGPPRIRAGLSQAQVVAGQWLGWAERMPWWLVGAIAAAAVVALVGLRWRERRAARGHDLPWRQVIELGKQGQHPLSIARATGVPQDVVRIVLAPVSPDSSVGRGNSFRAPGEPTGRPPQSIRRRPAS
jgi:hypothetical protein